MVNNVLNYSDKLRAVYEWKEAFISWYDCSPSFESALPTFRNWCEQGRKLGYPPITSCVRTMVQWEESICNYHKLRFTNAVVEGRHNKIKALQRRHYFTRNRLYYTLRILVECNREQVVV